MFYAGMAWRQIAVAVCVGDADDDQRWNEIVVREEIDDAANFVNIRAAVRHIQHGVAFFLPPRCSGHPHPNHTIFIQNIGVNDQALWRGRCQILGQ
jgi:hypothetical protein